MPKLKDATIQMQDRYITFNVHYFEAEGGRYNATYDAGFLYTPPANMANGLYPQWVSFNKRGKNYAGLFATTQEVAKQMAREYLEWYTKEQLKDKKMVIFIERPESTMRSFDSMQSVSVKFQFIVAFGVEVAGKTTWYKDNEYHDLNTRPGELHSLYNANNYVQVDYNEHNLTRCEAIVTRMREMQNHIAELFSTPEKAIEALGAPKFRLMPPKE